MIDNPTVMGALSVLVVRDDGDDEEDGDFHLATPFGLGSFFCVENLRLVVGVSCEGKVNQTIGSLDCH